MRHWRDYGKRKLEGAGRALPLATFPLSLGYEALMRLRNRSYDSGLLHSHRLPVPVISVGNITLGGTGKTPTVIMLARLLQEQGYRPAVISRGYGGTGDSPVTIVSDGRALRSSVGKAGDEPMLMARSLEGVPVLTAHERVDAGRVALAEFDVNLLILDDAFQHRRICRDVDIVLVDGARPFGNGCIVPGGTLREPPSSIGRAHLVIVTDGKLGSLDAVMEGIAPAVPLLYAERRPGELVAGNRDQSVPLEYLRGKRVAAFAGIASPDRLRETLEPWCGSLETFLAWPDHHNYSEDDIAVLREAAAGVDVLVTTEKDGERLRCFEDFYTTLLLLRIEMRLISAQEELVKIISGKIAQ